ncbi:hypothetical protein CDL12_29326 [Handroanthus impetiginosus]|uniref:Uncharacterized protein n=1 Tax=Handroanthus impetiginosus TaxID=429701 RepID=A0A2G9FYQ9_9LAMI|nr:hypothetical protein CDL12_29326 [Handroanthus impetiginosus]
MHGKLQHISFDNLNHVKPQNCYSNFQLSVANFAFSEPSPCSNISTIFNMRSGIKKEDFDRIHDV